jgi:hypothetical protein
MPEAAALLRTARYSVCEDNNSCEKICASG